MKGVPNSNAENDTFQTRFIRQEDTFCLESVFLRTLTLSVVLQGLTLTLLTLSVHLTIFPQIEIQYDQILAQVVLTSLSPTPEHHKRHVDEEESMK